MPTAVKSEKPSSASARRLAQRTSQGSLQPAVPPPTKIPSWAFCFALVLITFATYLPVLHNSFVNYDDVDYVTQNRHVQQGVTFSTFSWALTSTEAGNWHPLTWMSHAVDFELFGLDPAGHHFSSLLLHAANSVLVFLLLLRITGAAWRSVAVAALFALHPINVESVAWVAERKTVLCMFFFLLALGAYGAYVARPDRKRYAAVCIFFVLALAAKPLAVTFPFVLLLLDFWPLQRFELDSSSLRKQTHLLFEKLPLFALSLASCVITLFAQRPAMKTIDAIPFRERASNALFSYVMYLWKALWPAHLSVFYAPQGHRLSAWQPVLCALFLVAVTAVFLKLSTRKYLIVGWLWFLGTLVPMIGLIQVGEQGMADRYAYLSFLGLFVIAVWGVADVCAEMKLTPIVPAALTASILIALACLTWKQVHTWKDTVSMWSHSLEVTPANFVAEDSIGTVLLEDGFKSTGENCVDQALVHFQNAIRIYPADALGHLNVGFCLQSRGRFGDAIAQYQAGLQSARSQYLRSRAYLNLGGAYDDQGLLEPARNYFQRAAAIAPRDPQIMRALAKVDVETKVVDLSRSLAANPTATGFLQLAQLQAQLGRIDDARSSLRNALRLDPASAEVRNALQQLEGAQ